MSDLCSSHLPLAPLKTHTTQTLLFINSFYSSTTSRIVLNGNCLTIPKLCAISKNISTVKADIASLTEVDKNARYFKKKIEDGNIIYGVNTGYGGSADVRSNDLKGIQTALIQHLNAGFGECFDADITRGLMAIRANSLCRAMSGVRPDVIELIIEMLNQDIVPEVPIRGSVSASGDLMPTSYVAAAMMGRADAKVSVKGRAMSAPDALAQAGLEPITFQAKEALAVVNASSCAASLAANVLYETNRAVLLTQVAVALSHEALLGRRESFHPTISSICLPHPGHTEVAHNVWELLEGSKFAITENEINRIDDSTTLKQDRYALRTSAQWLAPVIETLLETTRRIEIELNSTGDNPIIDHHGNNILHCGNFQGTSITVAMDQTRQAIQLCGKLLFAQLSEILNVKMSNGLPPNLNGSDTSSDFGYKGTDTAMASYMSELDWLTPPLTNHVVSAEMHNQAVNSLALISARRSKESLDILYMMLANILNAQIQAIDLRYLQRKVKHKLAAIFESYDIKMVSDVLWPWYEFAFSPKRTTENMLTTIDCLTTSEEIITVVETSMDKLMDDMYKGSYVKTLAENLGKGSSEMYLFLRGSICKHFYHGKRSLDNDLKAIYDAIKNQTSDQILCRIFQKHVVSQPLSSLLGVQSNL